jgi:hypothetical protein
MYSNLPQLAVNPIYSFSPYPVTSRSYLHNALLRSIQPKSTQSSSSTSSAGPGPSTERMQREKRAFDRAARRALAGRRPAGVALGREADELSDEEAELEDERVG